MNVYNNILKNRQIGKREFSNLSESVYDAFLSERIINEDSNIDLEEMELIINLLEQQRKVVKYLLYNHKLRTREQRAEAIGFLSKVISLKEAFDIAQGKITLEEIQDAAKTLAPKMQSSFEP
jgi:hypothetical protein